VPFLGRRCAAALRSTFRGQGSSSRVLSCHLSLGVETEIAIGIGETQRVGLFGGMRWTGLLRGSVSQGEIGVYSGHATGDG
jgi:hypothetical protein